MIVEILLGIVILLLIFLILTVRRNSSLDGEAALENLWRDSRLEEKIGELNTHAREIKTTHLSIENMLRVPKERASLGEMGLECILSDQLPPSMYGIRARIPNGRVPDAHIRSTAGTICIDSKFPLDNYRAMVGSEGRERERLKSRFIKDVRGHLEKVSRDYVSRDGTADFAFAYIPSEGVYYFLVEEANSMLMDFARRGVQVVSPLTLSHKLEIVKAGAHAMKLSQEAEEVREELKRLERGFRRLDESWRVFYNHLRNAHNKAGDLDSNYRELREEFQRVKELEGKEKLEKEI